MYKVIFVVALLVALPAMAQNMDQRLVGPAIQKLQGDAAWAEARLKAALEDMEAMRKRLCEVVPDDKQCKKEEAK